MESWHGIHFTLVPQIRPPKHNYWAHIGILNISQDTLPGVPPLGISPFPRATHLSVRHRYERLYTILPLAPFDVNRHAHIMLRAVQNNPAN